MLIGAGLDVREAHCHKHRYIGAIEMWGGEMPLDMTPSSLEKAHAPRVDSNA